MVDKVHGASRRHESLTGNLQYFTLYTTLDITNTGDLADATQQDFELVVQTMSLRALPIVMTDVVASANLATDGAPTLTGAGFIWRFVTEREDALTVAFLVEDFDGLVLNAGTVDTVAPGVNTEFTKDENLNDLV